MIAYFDCQSGASGDMILGALVDAGLPLAQLQQSIDQLDIGARLRAERVMRCGVSATRISVEIADQRAIPPRTVEARSQPRASEGSVPSAIPV